MKQKQLAIELSKIDGFSSPQEHLEQYSSPSDVAAHVLHTAYMQGDIEGKIVADLGCGPGIFAIGAKLLGAETVYGVDLDEQAIKLAKENAKKLGVEVEWICSPVEGFDTQVDTIVQNPPFGVKDKHADRPFLTSALKCAKKVYSLHLSNPENRNFIRAYVESLGSGVVGVETLPFNLPPTLSHHTKSRHEIKVDLYILEVK